MAECSCHCRELMAKETVEMCWYGSWSVSCMFLCLFWFWRNWHKTVLPSKWNNTVQINIDLLLFSCLWTFKNQGLSFFTDMYVVGYCDRERSLVQLVAVRTQMYGMYISSSGLEIFVWVFASSKLKSLKQQHGRQDRILRNFCMHNHWMIQAHCDSCSSFFLAAGITFDVLCDVKGLSCKLSMCSMTSHVYP